MLKICTAVLLLSFSGCTFPTSFAIPDKMRKPAHVRVWIDTDLACSEDLTSSDPDDFLAYLLAKRAGMNIMGISTVAGNASAEDVWETATKIVDPTIYLYRGSNRCDLRIHQKDTPGDTKGLLDYSGSWTAYQYCNIH